MRIIAALMVLLGLLSGFACAQTADNKQNQINQVVLKTLSRIETRLSALEKSVKQLTDNSSSTGQSSAGLQGQVSQLKQDLNTLRQASQADRQAIQTLHQRMSLWDLQNDSVKFK